MLSARKAAPINQGLWTVAHQAGRRHLRLGLLIMAVLLSALTVIYIKHETRKLFIEAQQLQKERDELQTEWGQLQLEQSTWATHVRVESLARTKLDMLLPPPETMVIVTP